MKNIPIYLLLLIISLCCQRKISNQDFEKKVFYEIFPQIIDLTCIDIRIYSSFPPAGESVFDKQGNFLYSDTSKVVKERKAWREKIKNLKNDNAKLIIVFDPNIKESHFDNGKEFESYFGKKLIPYTIKKDTASFVLDFKKLKSKGKFHLMHADKFPKGREIWDKKYNFILCGALDVNNIQFDKEKKYGVLSAGFYCGGKCGQGFRIYIKKIKDYWKIVKVDGTWIS
jgi:transcription elongation factor Elf1